MQSETETILTNNKNKNKYIANGKFDTTAFNADFKIVLQEQLIRAENIEQEHIDKYNDYYRKLSEYKEEERKYKSTINSLTLSKILVKWGDAVKSIMMEIIKLNYNLDGFVDIFIKEDRLIYIGMTIIVIAIFGYLINEYLLADNTTGASINIVTNNYLSEEKQKLVDLSAATNPTISNNMDVPVVAKTIPSPPSNANTNIKADGNTNVNANVKTNAKIKVKN
jgi:hypothetical protein